VESRRFRHGRRHRRLRFLSFATTRDDNSVIVASTARSNQRAAFRYISVTPAVPTVAVPLFAERLPCKIGGVLRAKLFASLWRGEIRRYL
jgi:hypothetical protein